MSIEGLVVNEAMRHIEMFGQVKNMDAMSLHILKTSQSPVVRHMRHWMRQTALKQALAAEKQQAALNRQTAENARVKGNSLRLMASLAPYYAAQMPKKHNTTWGDPDFISSVREANPAIFPKRE